MHVKKASHIFRCDLLIVFLYTIDTSLVRLKAFSQLMRHFCHHKFSMAFLHFNTSNNLARFQSKYELILVFEGISLTSFDKTACVMQVVGDICLRGTEETSGRTIIKP